MFLFGSSINLIVFSISVVCVILNLVLSKKESPVSRTKIISSFIPIIATLAVYYAIFSRKPMSPLYIYLLLAGLLIGCIYGALTKVYIKNDVMYRKLSRTNMVIWSVIFLITQLLCKLLGTAIIGIGTSLMFFSLGVLITQNFIVMLKSGKIKRNQKKVLTSVGVFSLVVFLISPAFAAGSDNDLGTNSLAEIYFMMACDAFSQGDNAKATEYGLKISEVTDSQGTIAKGYMVAYLAGAGDQYGDMAAAALSNSGQLEGYSGASKNSGVALIGVGIIDTIQTWQYRGITLPQNDNIINLNGSAAIFSSQIPAYWDSYKNSSGLSGISNPAAVDAIKAVDALASEAGDSKPVSSAQATTAGAVAAAALLISGILNAVPVKSMSSGLSSAGASDANAASSGAGSVNTSTAKAATPSKPKKLHKAAASDSAAPDDWRAPTKTVLDYTDKIWGYAGQEGKGYEAVVDSVKNILNKNNEAVYKASMQLGNQSSAVTAIKTMITVENGAQTLQGLGKALGKGLTYGGIVSDAIGNMSESSRPDGTLIEGDGAATALGKAYVANTLVNKAMEKFPVLLAAEIGTFVTIGDTSAGSLLLPSNLMKGTLNMVMDTAYDPQKAIDRSVVGVYGDYIKTVADTVSLGGEAYKDSDRFADEAIQVGNSKSFYSGMQDTASTMFRDKSGNIGYVGSALEATAQFGVAMTETAAGMAQCAGDLTGALYEKTSYTFRSYFE